MEAKCLTLLGPEESSKKFESLKKNQIKKILIAGKNLEVAFPEVMEVNLSDKLLRNLNICTYQ